MRLSTPLFFPCGRMAKPAEGSRSTGREPEPICDFSETISALTGSPASAACSAGSRRAACAAISASGRVSCLTAVTRRFRRSGSR